MGKGDAEEGVTRCICGYNTDNEGLMIQCDTCHVWQHAECVGVTKSNVPELYYCYRCMPNHPIHRKHSQNAKSKQQKTKTRPAAPAIPATSVKAVQKLKPSHHGPAERVGHERPPSRRRASELSVDKTVDEVPQKQVQATENWFKSNWDYFEKVRQHNLSIKGFDPPPPPAPLPGFDTKESDLTPFPITEDASEVFQWAGVRATRGRLKEMGITSPAVKTTSNPLIKKKKKPDLFKQPESGDNAPRPYVGEQGIPPCAGLLMTWPWREATPLTPYYLGKKNYILKRMIEEQELEDKKAGGDVALRTFLDPIDRDMLLPLQARVLRAYQDSQKATTTEQKPAPSPQSKKPRH